MALIYHSNIRTAVAERGIRLGFSSPSVTIYSGTQPTAATIISSWSSYNSSSSNLLWHAQSGLAFSLQNNVTVYASAFPAATAPVRNGTASWAIVWGVSVAYSTMGTTTIPLNRFMVVPVTDQAGNGACKLASTSLSTGTAISITNLSFTVNI